MLDLHNHVLFGLDDGCRHVEDSRQLVENARAAGHRGFVATPHIRPGLFNNTPEIIQRRFEETRSIVTDGGLELFLGAEYYFDEKLLAGAKQRALLTLSGSRYVLTEFPQLQLPLRYQEVLFEMQVAGYVPVIAHPERCAGVQADVEGVLDVFERSGVLTQLDLGSLIGRYGRRSKKTAEEILKRGAYSVAAGDLHRPEDVEAIIPKSLAVLRKALTKRGAEKGLEQLISENPRRLVENQEPSSLARV